MAAAMTSVCSVIFDLDGTLVDSAAAIQLALNHALSLHGLPVLPLNVVRGFIGRGVPHLMDCVGRQIGMDTSSAQFISVSNAFSARYARQQHGNLLFDGVIEALQDLQESNVALGLCTNKPMDAARTVLQHIGIDAFFSVVVAGDSLPTRKPDPEMLWAARDRMGPAPCLYVGDSEVDAEAAHAAGIPFLLYTRGYRKIAAEELAPWRIFDDFGALGGLVGCFVKEMPQA
ncbi:phosphoglycolate phosphatase [Thioclava sp. 'Guangxiensis']|uniref:phosphoglycolate phosphatase n=1 Tax=Thioclava sp. 'Guangxiensis' TaxID=3149044 RepID=UPI0038781DFA